MICPKCGADKNKLLAEIVGKILMEEKLKLTATQITNRLVRKLFDIYFIDQRNMTRKEAVQEILEWMKKNDIIDPEIIETKLTVYGLHK